VEFVREVDTFTARHFDDLDAGRVRALRISEFVAPDVAGYLADRLTQHPSLSVYRNTSELMRVGESHYETHDEDSGTNPQALEEYLSRAETLVAEIRAACQPHPSPMDLLSRMLDESIGLRRAEIAGRPMFAGVVRVFPEGSELLPHNDVFARDAPGVAAASGITAQFAANIYLQVPDDGGTLQLWGLRPSEQELVALQAPGSVYGADRALLPAPDVEVAIRPGDLVVIDATRLHAVTRQGHGRRVGMSCFLGRRTGHPLICWS